MRPILPSDMPSAVSYQRTATTITSAGNRNPANAERGGDLGPGRAADFTGQPCLIIRSADATEPVIPSEVVTDAAPVYPAVLDELLPAAWHHVEQYANNPIEADPGQLNVG